MTDSPTDPPDRAFPQPPVVLFEDRHVLPHGGNAEGFLAIRRERMRARYEDGTRSEPFLYDAVERRAFDAVVILAHFMEKGARHVYLRSCVRPPVVMRGEAATAAALWELPAGLIEPGETPTAAAVRELGEEVGFHVGEERVLPLGGPVLPAPALIGERQWFLHVAVQAAERVPPHGDGSPLERHGRVAAVSVAAALDLARRGGLPDAKTELGLRRLAELP